MLSRIKEKKYWLLGIIAVFLLMTAVKPFSTYRDRAYKRAKREWLILTGGLVDVGGYYLRIDCRGSGRTVVFESGLSQPRETWGSVPNEIAKVARVCTYDRVNVGESDQTDLKRTSADVVRELRTLLEKTGEKGPFIFVGHSFGGLNARLYAMRYPAEVAGLVLVDPSHEDQYVTIAESKSPQERQEYLRHEGGENGEDVNLLASADELRSVAGRVQVPSILLTARSNPQAYLYDDSYPTESSDFQPVFPEHIVVDNSGHFIQQDRPDVVISAITEMLNYRKESDVTLGTR